MRTQGGVQPCLMPYQRQLSTPAHIHPPTQNAAKIINIPRSFLKILIISEEIERLKLYKEYLISHYGP